MRRAAVLPEKRKRRRDPARGLREISLAQGAPEGISALLRPAARGAAGVRTGHGHRTIAVLKLRAFGLAPLGPGRCPMAARSRTTERRGRSEKGHPSAVR